MRLPKAWFIHSIKYIVSDNGNGWDEATDNEIEVNGVRVSSPTKSFSSTTTTVTDTSRAILFVHPQHSTHVDFKKGNYIEFDGQRYMIGEVKRFSSATANVVSHWEIGLV